MAFTRRQRQQQQTQWNQQNDEYNEGEATDASWATARQLLEDRRNTYDSTKQFALKTARDVGLPVKGGKVDYSNATPEQLAAMEKVLGKTPLSDTQFITQTMDRIRSGNKELPPGQEDKILQYLNQNLAHRTQLAATDTAAITKQRELLDKEMNITTNPYFRPDRPSDVSAAELVRNIPGLDKMGQDFKEELIPEINRVMNGGEVEVDGELYKVTPELVEMALQFTEEDKWFSWDTNLEDALGKVLENQNMRDKYADYLDWKSRRQKLETEGKAAMGNGRSLSDMTAQLRRQLEQNRQ